ncbi:hypothetical protein [Mycobacterium persicum]|uniref:Uncharacterized protein n=1 Tax=Mycobacterium persicum TaxID=1487726 RepID=A0A8E2IVN5_9MYCO|nr:hypothetical protein [Mycobacterium persicum]KZS81809.1 hypothetical protein A4G31_20765 [Mycobacterium persicum]ORC08789.1 hypothetical protein B4U45_21530 [Mycobacterium persicum]
MSRITASLVQPERTTRPGRRDRTGIAGDDQLGDDARGMARIRLTNHLTGALLLSYVLSWTPPRACTPTSILAPTCPTGRRSLPEQLPAQLQCPDAVPCAGAGYPLDGLPRVSLRKASGGTGMALGAAGVVLFRCRARRRLVTWVA